MASFLDFLLPKNTGLTKEQMGFADTRGLTNAAAVIANLNARGGANPVQLISNGLLAYQQGGNGAIDEAYQSAVNQAAAAQAAVGMAADKENLDWFNNRKNRGMPTLRDFYSPSLTDAQIQVESGGNPNAVSSKGARGLMQIMPGTGKAPGLGVTPLQNDTPQENVRFGEDYQNALMKKYNNNPEHALMAYNWGTGNVDSWLKNGANPAAVPAETRDYVNKLLPIAQGQQKTGDVGQANRFYDLAEMQIRAGRTGGDALLRLAGYYDPKLERINRIGTPAAIQLADELARARSSGDTQRVNDLTAIMKIYEKGMTPGADGKIEAVPGFIDTKRDISYGNKAGEKDAENDASRIKAASDVVAKIPLVENDLNIYRDKLSKVPPSLMGPIVGTPAYYASPAIQDLTSTTRSIALQLKDIYNLGSGQGFTDADRDYLDSIIGGAKVDPMAAQTILDDMYKRVALQKEIYTQTVDYYNKNNTLKGFIPQINGGGTGGGGNAGGGDGWSVRRVN